MMYSYMIHLVMYNYRSTSTPLRRSTEGAAVGAGAKEAWDDNDDGDRGSKGKRINTWVVVQILFFFLTIIHGNDPI